MKVEAASQKNLMRETGLFDRLKQVIDGHQHFVITTHLLPDGDGLGGEIALAAYLRAIGKTCHIINADPTPDKFSIVDPDGDIQIWKPDMVLPKAEVVFGVDVNEEERCGPHVKVLKDAGAKVIFIDHHIIDEPLKDHHIIDEGVSSMGEFFYRYFHHEKEEITFKMALAMYVSIVTDTRQFRHRKTSALSHVIAAALVEIGIDPADVHHRVHQNRSLEEMHFLGEALGYVQKSNDGKIIWMEVTQALQNKYGMGAEDSQGFVDYLLTIKDVEVCMLFREEANKKVKVSFRSKGNVEIYPFVKSLGGGGHAYEAGVLMDGSLDHVVKKILSTVQKLIG